MRLRPRRSRLLRPCNRAGHRRLPLAPRIPLGLLVCSLVGHAFAAWESYKATLRALKGQWQLIAVFGYQKSSYISLNLNTSGLFKRLSSFKVFHSPLTQQFCKLKDGRNIFKLFSVHFHFRLIWRGRCVLWQLDKS